MVGVTPEIMRQGMRTDYRMVDRLSDRLRERMLRAETLTVKTEAGTQFAAHFDRGLDWVKTSGLISPRYWSNLPAGEVFHYPRPRRRHLRLRRHRWRPLQRQVRRFAAHPAGPRNKRRPPEHVECERKDLEHEFWDYCHTDENSDRVGELAFGTNSASPK